MRENEARELLDALEALYNQTIPEREAWERTLLTVNAETASNVILKRWVAGPRPSTPSLPMLMQAIRFEERRRSGETVTHALVPELASQPRWIETWRFMRAHGDYRALPEQRHGYEALWLPWPPREGVLTTEERVEIERRART